MDCQCTYKTIDIRPLYPELILGDYLEKQGNIKTQILFLKIKDLSLKDYLLNFEEVGEI